MLCVGALNILVRLYSVCFRAISVVTDIGVLVVPRVLDWIRSGRSLEYWEPRSVIEEFNRAESGSGCLGV